VLIVVPLSVLAACLFALAAVLQQRAARQLTARQVAAASSGEAARGRTGAVWLPASAIIHHLVRNRVWRWGWAVNLVGFAAQAAALAEGSPAVVQPVMVTQLLFTLLLSGPLFGRLSGLVDGAVAEPDAGSDAGTAAGRRGVRAHRMSRWEWAGGGAVCAGLVVLLSVRGAAPAGGAVNRPRLLLCSALICAAAAMLVVASGHRREVLRASLLACAAGMFTSLSAALTKATIHALADTGVAGTARDWVGYLLAATVAIGLLLGQDAFAAGPLPASMTALTITNPIVGYLLGIFAFHTSPPASAGSLAGVAAAGLLIVSGVALLARSPVVVGALPDGPA
jgi:hypothetical protein